VRLTEPRVAAHKTTTPHEFTTGGIGDPRQSFNTSLSRQRIVVLSHRRPACYMAKQLSEMRVSRRRVFLIPAPRHDDPDSKFRSSRRRFHGTLNRHCFFGLSADRSERNSASFQLRQTTSSLEPLSLDAVYTAFQSIPLWRLWKFWPRRTKGLNKQHTWARACDR
jgi:hypothetical protein